MKGLAAAGDLDLVALGTALGLLDLLDLVDGWDSWMRRLFLVSSVHANQQGSTVATISNIDFESMNDSNILDEPELQTAPWFQSGMPR